MVNNISFTSIFSPETTHRRHVEGELINPESDIENLHLHHSQPSEFGKIGTEPQEVHCFGKLSQGEPLISLEELIGRSQIARTIGNGKEMSIFDSKSVNCTSLYSMQELEEILDRFEDRIEMPITPDYEVIFYSDLDRLVINHGEAVRNFTTVIFNDGSAMQNGCMSSKKVAEAGSCIDIIEDVKSRIKQLKKES